MLRKCIVVALSTLGLVLMGCDGTIVSPEVDPSSALARVLVPIYGDFTYFYFDAGVPGLTCEVAFSSGDLLGAGIASHLGSTTFEFHPETCATDFRTQTQTVVGSANFTGANGDAISATLTAILDLSEFLSGTTSLGAFEFTGPITGGTGRFAGATGSLSGTGVNDFRPGLVSGKGTFTFNGMISTVGSISP